MKNKNDTGNGNQMELSCIRKRAMGLVLDFLIWYGVYFLMLIMVFITKFGTPEVSGDLSYYKQAFDGIIKSPLFIIVYLSFLVLWEIIIPMLTEGQSLFKQKLKIKITVDNKRNTRVTLAVRGLVKLMVLNTYGVIAYVLGNLISANAVNVVSNTMSILLVISIIAVVLGKNTIYDMILGTKVIIEK